MCKVDQECAGCSCHFSAPCFHCIEHECDDCDHEQEEQEDDRGDSDYNERGGYTRSYINWINESLR
jgi:hypothetical protein